MNSHLVLKNWIKLYRKKAGLSQSQLAKELNCSRNTISAIERGIFCPSAYLAYLLCEFFDCAFEDLFYLQKVY